MIIALSWPDSKLNPNFKAHWAVKHRAISLMKWKWHMELSLDRQKLLGRRNFNVRFQAPNKRRRDVDNVIASLKYMQDTLATFCGCDDSQLRIQWPVEFATPVKGGRVILETVE